MSDDEEIPAIETASAPIETRDECARPGSPDAEDVLRELEAIRADMVAAPTMSYPRLDEVHPNYRESARNLLHYVALRRHDIRPLQLRLAALGLSSLGRGEAHILATVDAVLGVLRQLLHRTGQMPSPEAVDIDIAKGQRLLTEHTDGLLGEAPAGRSVRIMVTMPSEAAEDFLLVNNLLKQGMDCMRINCAHDDAAAWLQMLEHLRRAERSLRRTCRVVMDLAGPKLRTGPLEPGPAVVRIRPRRDVYGRVTKRARVWLTSETSPCPAPSPANASLRVPAKWLTRLQTGERLKFTDARNAKRTFEVVDVTDCGCWVEATKTAYIAPDTVLYHQGGGNRDDRDAVVGGVPNLENSISLTEGDRLVLTRELRPGRGATYDNGGQILSPPMIGCTIPEVFENVRPGEPIWFDDGKIGGVIEKVEEARVLVRIDRARLMGEKLRGDKGINLPESDLRLPAITAKDLEDLSFIALHADVVELSYVNTAADVELLQRHLARLGGRQPAIVVKIETRHGFENLPDILLTAMRAPCCGVMIARGDLAVECGFERLAEVQEEILWICEAAHVPVIWATQVLETLAKEGTPSRAEITDAAMGERAECVMLNKGPHIQQALLALDDILQRMQNHQSKKSSMLRHLTLADHFPGQRKADPAADRPWR
jgi:pyruvate kinase